MKVVILAGGLGTRLGSETELRPKPMVEIGGLPILWHVMNIFAAQGHDEFVLALGYKQEVIKDYFLNYFVRNNDLTVDLGSGRSTVHGGARVSWTVHLVDTGLHTQTGGRLRRLRPWLGSEPFLMTYGDGVADVDLSALIATHRAAGRLVTVTAVHPAARFGALTLEGDAVARFSEKPQTQEGWVNGGFFVIEPAALEAVAGDDTPWELEPLERLAAEGQVTAWRHEGFWQPMDTPRDRRLLEQLWESGQAPWRR